MAKIRIEVFMISARGLRRSSSFWKLQWFAVGWINPDQKYCSKIDSSGSSNPTWKTKFSATFDDSHVQNLHDLALNIAVYRREPIFLKEKLYGTATVLLKEFFAKNTDAEEVGSFQLRKKKSGRPRGFVDVSIRISEENEVAWPSYSGNEEGGFNLSDQKNGISLRIEGPQLPYRNQPHVGQQEKYHHQPPFSYTNPSVGGPSYHPTHTPALPPPSYRPSRTPPPPPPPSNVGFIPTFLPGTSELPPAHYINLPASNAAGAGVGRAGGPGFGMGVGAGALAAGAVIFGDDFMSGLDFPTGLQGGSLSVSMDPTFSD